MLPRLAEPVGVGHALFRDHEPGSLGAVKHESRRFQKIQIAFRDFKFAGDAPPVFFACRPKRGRRFRDSWLLSHFFNPLSSGVRVRPQLAETPTWYFGAEVQ